MTKVFKAKVHVTLKKSVLDPQGQTILQALGHMNFPEIKSCRVGKFFEMEVETDSREKAEAKLRTAAHDLLSNPVIEDYTLEVQ
jgi:phosphoribosylformylglycinamidine synthase